MNTVTVTLGNMIDRVLFDLLDHTSTPLHAVLDGALTDSAVTLTLVDASSVNISDVLEIGSELLLVTGKSEDAVPVITVSRHYYQTTAAAHADQSLVTINPLHSRRRIAEALRRCFPRLESLGLPLIQTDTAVRVEDNQYIQMPADTRQVLRVGYMSTTGRWTDIGKWTFIDDVPTSIASTGKILRLSRLISNDDELIITWRTPYRWSTHPDEPDETSTITMIEGTEDLPLAYATAWLLARREIARQDLSRAEEWNQGEPSRSGVSTAVVRLQWQEFYRLLDEAKRLIPSLPVQRPYVPMPRI